MTRLALLASVALLGLAAAPAQAGFRINRSMDGVRLGMSRAEVRDVKGSPAEPGGRADDLDHLDLLVPRAREHDVEGGLLLGGSGLLLRSGAARGRRRRGDGRRRDAELLLERLDALGELEHGDALELLDPLLGAGSHGLLVLLRFGVVGLRRSIR